MGFDRRVEQARELARPFRVTDGARFRLKDFDPGDTRDLDDGDKPAVREALADSVEALAGLQDRLYAQDRWAVLLVFQAMDAAGKDSAIKHVMSGLNPQGCQVFSFKAPSAEELDHDYLWRCVRCLPERGRIGIFNRSYYEETLVVRVHPEWLDGQKLPPSRVTKDIWDDRFQDVRALERHLDRNGTVVCKFFLYVSKDEQRRRFLERIDHPAKRWKFSAADVAERKHWDAYMEAYEDTIRQTAAERAPWYVVPADHKWFTRLVVAGAVVETLASLDLRYPEPDARQRKVLAAARAELEREDGARAPRGKRT